MRRITTKKNTDPQTDILFVSLPNRMIEGVVKDIDAAFDEFENNVIEQNELAQVETVKKIIPAVQQNKSYFQQLKTYWQAGYDYGLAPK